MPWIEGIGDEVTLFFVAVSMLVVGIIAWLSTNIGDQPLIRTVLILERRARTRESFDTPQAVNDPTQSAAGSDTDATAIEDVEEAVTETAHYIEECDEQSTDSVANEANIAEVAGDCDASIEPQLAECYDTDCFECRSSFQSTEGNVSGDSEIIHNSCLLRRRRLGFFQNRQATLLVPPVETTESSTTGTPLPVVGHIRIRLKYLNDDQKLVEGTLEEQLGNFKRRNFSSELSAQKLIRLIFNGHVLERDEDTLGSYGLFDNCVVHCLVHQHRTSTDPQLVPDGMSPSDAGLNRDWHMGSILFVLLSLILGLVWYCRYQYSHLFNASTTVALIGLTGILTVSLVGIYLPDQDAVR